jgi:hypothetical protein
MLTCNNLSETNGIIFNEWKNITYQRELLAELIINAMNEFLQNEMLYMSDTSLTTNTSHLILPSTTSQSMVADNNNTTTNNKINKNIPRLIYLLKQSMTYQVHNTHSYHNTNSTHNNTLTHKPSTVLSSTYNVKSLISDYHPIVYPKTLKSILCPLSNNITLNNINHNIYNNTLKLSCISIIKQFHTSNYSNVTFGNMNGITVLGGTENGTLLQWFIPYITNNNEDEDNNSNNNDSNNDSHNNCIQQTKDMLINTSLSKEYSGMLYPFWYMKIRGIETHTNEWISSSNHITTSTSTSSMINIGVTDNANIHRNKNMYNYPPKIRDISVSANGNMIATSLSDGSVLLLKQLYSSSSSTSSSDNYTTNSKMYSSAVRNSNNCHLSHRSSKSMGNFYDNDMLSNSNNNDSNNNIDTISRRISLHEVYIDTYIYIDMNCILIYHYSLRLFM